jgi:hypothetical protein
VHVLVNTVCLWVCRNDVLVFFQVGYLALPGLFVFSHFECFASPTDAYHKIIYTASLALSVSPLIFEVGNFTTCSVTPRLLGCRDVSLSSLILTGEQTYRLDPQDYEPVHALTTPKKKTVHFFYTAVRKLVVTNNVCCVVSRG